MTTTTPNKTSLANMSPETTALVAEDIGMIVLNAALIRVFMDLSAEDTVKFESFLQTNPIPSALLNFLFEIHENPHRGEGPRVFFLHIQHRLERVVR